MRQRVVQQHSDHAHLRHKAADFRQDLPVPLRLHDLLAEARAVIRVDPQDPLPDLMAAERRGVNGQVAALRMASHIDLLLLPRKMLFQVLHSPLLGRRLTQETEVEILFPAHQVVVRAPVSHIDQRRSLPFPDPEDHRRELLLPLLVHHIDVGGHRQVPEALRLRHRLQKQRRMPDERRPRLHLFLRMDRKIPLHRLPERILPVFIKDPFKIRIR